MPTIRDKNAPPPEGWQYPALAGPNVKASDYNLLHGNVVKHYRSNGQEPPEREAVDAWMCENLTVRCQEGNAPFRNRYTDPPSFLSRGKKSPDWPLILRPFKLLSQSEDRGLGDIVLRVIGDANSAAFKAWFRKMFGKECGCEKRQNTLNIEFPL